MASTESRSPTPTIDSRLESLERENAALRGRVARLARVASGTLGAGLLVLAGSLLAWSRSPDRIETTGILLHGEPGHRHQRFHLAIGDSGLPIWWWLDEGSGKFRAAYAVPPDVVAAFGQGESATSR